MGKLQNIEEKIENIIDDYSMAEFQEVNDILKIILDRVNLNGIYITDEQTELSLLMYKLGAFN